MRRKLLFCTICMMVGILLFLNLSYIFCFIVVLIVGLICYLTRTRWKKISVVLLMIVFITIGIMRGFVANYYYNQCIIENPHSSIIVAEVEKAYRKDDGLRLQCKIITNDSKRESGKVLVSYFGKFDEYWNLYGITISFNGELDNPSQAGNPRTFDYQKYLRSEGIYYVSNCYNFDILSERKGLGDRIISQIIKVRDNFINSLDCTESTRGFISGVIFGDKSMMDEDVYKEFQNNGTAHILAVSGLHVGVLYGIYKKLYEKNRKKYITFGFIILLIIYGTMTLWSVSITRAIFLIILITIGDLLNRRYDLITSLSFVCIILLIRNPYIIENVGFQMSFLAVASISFFGRILAEKLDGNLSTMLAVQIGMIPYTAYVFNYIPFGALICNIPIIFMISVLVPVGLFAFFINFVCNISVVNILLCAISKFTIELNSFLAIDGVFSVQVVSPKLWILIPFYLTSFFFSSEFFRVLWLRKNKGIIAGAICIIIICSVMCFFIEKSEFDDAFLVFVDVGQGDCIHISLKNHKDLLVDGGGNINYNIGEKTLKPYLLKNGVRNIDVACATHLHTDHFLGIKQLEECFDVKKIITEGEAGDVIKIDKYTYIEILWPIERGIETEDENLNSLIFKIHYKNLSVLVTGDITEEGEQKMLAYYKGRDILKCDVLKVAHHGSKYSTCKAFLEEVSPTIAIISVGKNNYGHPSNEVIEKLINSGIMVYRTDYHGAIGLIEEKGRLNICTKKQK